MSIDFNSHPGAHIAIHSHVKPNSSQSQKQASDDDFWGKDGFGFDDLIDLINPLQHIPVVSSVYRELTGDEIAPGPRMIGGAVVGGVTGFIASAANVIYEQATGNEIAQSVVAAFAGGAEPAQKLTDNASGSAVYGETQVAYRAPTPLLNLHEIQELEPLEFGAVDLPPELPAASLHAKNDDQPTFLDPLMELVAPDVTAVSDQYRNAQMMSHILDVAEDMKI